MPITVPVYSSFVWGALMLAGKTAGVIATNRTIAIQTKIFAGASPLIVRDFILDLHILRVGVRFSKRLYVPITNADRLVCKLLAQSGSIRCRLWQPRCQPVGCNVDHSS